MKFIFSLFLISSSAFAELPSKVFAEPYIEISRMEKYSELKSINSAVAKQADLIDTYSIGLAFPVEL